MSLKRIFYGNHLWFGLVAATAALIFVTQMGWIDEPYVAGGIVAFVISTLFLVQRQKLEETRLFKDLFTSFNERYDRLNDKLAAIGNDSELDAVTRSKLIDYFNLCAEEFLFYREGYINDEVWKAWCRGMLQYLELRPVAELWRSEQSTGSYYGLSLETINEGARD
jgi:hypothetical protein